MDAELCSWDIRMFLGHTYGSGFCLWDTRGKWGLDKVSNGGYNNNMPVIKVSNEVYQELLRRQAKDGNVMSIVMDRLMAHLKEMEAKPKIEVMRNASPTSLGGVKPEPEIEAKPKPKPEPPKPEPKKEPWPWTRPRGVNYKCGKCGDMVNAELREGHERGCKGGGRFEI